MPTLIPFDPTKSYCYRVARYEFLDLIAKEEEALCGEPFRMVEVVRRLLDRYLTTEQQEFEIPAAQANRVDTIGGAIKFYVQLCAKNLPNSPFVYLRNGGMYKLKEDFDLANQIEDELEADDFDGDDNESIQFDGWIYAFSFPVLIREDVAFPIKIGKTINNVEDRVAWQCRGSASFENPIILGKWQVQRVHSFEQAIHQTLKTRGKWRENAPGTEWFDTTISEIELLVSQIRG